MHNFQTQAGNFQTTTTPSSTYHAGSQYSSQYNTPSTPTFSQPTAVSAAATASHKGTVTIKRYESEIPPRKNVQISSAGTNQGFGGFCKKKNQVFGRCQQLKVWKTLKCHIKSGKL